MKTKLKELNIKLTELSNYMKITRPTLYKYIEQFELKEYKSINKKALKVLEFIDNEDTVSKTSVVNFIINNVRESETEHVVKLPVKLRKIYKLLLELDKEEIEEIYQKINGRE